ncbi:hypothetical protein BB559_004524 [Furculomyces boomerangus]|uniref:Uncharacterized protein n=1 Tax=Furculomyces boomerangus TaxID=61424 RepID=A0A2T9YEB3_9FUNG|nr:hypothetical protein BB559_004524 [Furculomyces boomerangus]
MFKPQNSTSALQKNSNNTSASLSSFNKNIKTPTLKTAFPTKKGSIPNYYLIKKNPRPKKTPQNSSIFGLLARQHTISTLLTDLKLKNKIYSVNTKRSLHTNIQTINHSKNPSSEILSNSIQNISEEPMLNTIPSKNPFASQTDTKKTHGDDSSDQDLNSVPKIQLSLETQLGDTKTENKAYFSEKEPLDPTFGDTINKETNANINIETVENIEPVFDSGIKSFVQQQKPSTSCQQTPKTKTKEFSNNLQDRKQIKISGSSQNLDMLAYVTSHSEMKQNINDSNQNISPASLSGFSNIQKNLMTFSSDSQFEDITQDTLPITKETENSSFNYSDQAQTSGDESWKKSFFETASILYKDSVFPKRHSDEKNSRSVEDPRKNFQNMPFYMSKNVDVLASPTPLKRKSKRNTNGNIEHQTPLIFNRLEPKENQPIFKPEENYKNKFDENVLSTENHNTLFQENKKYKNYSPNNWPETPIKTNKVDISQDNDESNKLQKDINISPVKNITPIDIKPKADVVNFEDNTDQEYSSSLIIASFKSLKNRTSSLSANKSEYHTPRNREMRQKNTKYPNTINVIKSYTNDGYFHKNSYFRENNNYTEHSDFLKKRSREKISFKTPVYKFGENLYNYSEESESTETDEECASLEPFTSPAKYRNRYTNPFQQSAKATNTPIQKIDIRYRTFHENEFKTISCTVPNYVIRNPSISEYNTQILPRPQHVKTSTLLLPKPPLVPLSKTPNKSHSDYYRIIDPHTHQTRSENRNKYYGHNQNMRSPSYILPHLQQEPGNMYHENKEILKTPLKERINQPYASSSGPGIIRDSEFSVPKERVKWNLSSSRVESGRFHDPGKVRFIEREYIDRHKSLQTKTHLKGNNNHIAIKFIKDGKDLTVDEMYDRQVFDFISRHKKENLAKNKMDKSVKKEIQQSDEDTESDEDLKGLVKKWYDGKHKTKNSDKPTEKTSFENQKEIEAQNKNDDERVYKYAKIGQLDTFSYFELKNKFENYKASNSFQESFIDRNQNPFVDARFYRHHNEISRNTTLNKSGHINEPVGYEFRHHQGEESYPNSYNFAEKSGFGDMSLSSRNKRARSKSYNTINNDSYQSNSGMFEYYEQTGKHKDYGTSKDEPARRRSYTSRDSYEFVPVGSGRIGIYHGHENEYSQGNRGMFLRSRSSYTRPVKKYSFELDFQTEARAGNLKNGTPFYINSPRSQEYVRLRKLKLN